MQVRDTLAAVAAGPARAATYDLAAQFSTASNPNGVWSYGYETTLGGTFNLYPDTAPVLGFEARDDTSVPGFSTFSVPSDFYNPSGSAVTSGTVMLAPHQAAFHPGEANQISLYQFTAPTAGKYTAHIVLAGGDNSDSTATVVYGLIDNVPTGGSHDIVGDGPGSEYSETDLLTLTAGETVAFGVGQLDGHFFNDTTTIGVTFTTLPVPEPASLALLGAGVLGLGLVRRRRC